MTQTLQLTSTTAGIGNKQNLSTNKKSNGNNQ